MSGRSIYLLAEPPHDISRGEHGVTQAGAAVLGFVGGHHVGGCPLLGDLRVHRNNVVVIKQ